MRITGRRFSLLIGCIYTILILQGNQKIKLSQLFGLINIDKTSSSLSEFFTLYISSFMVREYKVSYSLRFAVNRYSQFRWTLQIKPLAGAPDSQSPLVITILLSSRISAANYKLRE